MLKSRCQIAVFDIICFPALCDSHSRVYILPASAKLVPDGFGVACDTTGPIINQKTVPQRERTEGRAVDVFYINVTAKLFPFLTGPPPLAWLQYNILWPINTFGYLTRQRLFSAIHYSWWGAVVPYRAQTSVPYMLESYFVKVTRDLLWGPRSLTFNVYWRLLQWS